MTPDRYTGLAATVVELVNLQLVLSPDRNSPMVQAVAYAYGMYDCATQIERLEMNTAEAQTALKALFSVLFDEDPTACFELLKAEQGTQPYQTAAVKGGDDYNQWFASKGHSMPTGLIAVLKGI